MKYIIFIFSLFLIFQCYSEETKKENTNIIVNKIILPKTDDSYMEVRHIVLQGSNVEIGHAIGEIAQSWLKIMPGKYINMLYAKARNKYMLNNNPILYSRMIGVGNAYNVPYNNTLLDLSSLPYALGAYSCTAVNFPASIMKNNCNVIARNNGSYLISLNDMLETPHSEKTFKLFAKNYVMEIYPDIGYSSIVVGSFDLLNGVFDGLNSTGLYVGCMAVDAAPIRYTNHITGGNMTGSSMLQATRQVLDNCSTVEEAKILLLSLKVSNVLTGLHMMVVDRNGDSFIFELGNENDEAEITDNNGMPQIMTHFNAYMYPDESHFPKSYEKNTGDPFYRYTILDNEIKNAKKKLTQDEVWEMMNKVYINSMKTPEGLKYEIPFRTLWKVMINQNTLDCKVIFYLNDSNDSKDNSTLNFSKPFTFKLGQLKKKGKTTSNAQKL